LDIKQLFYQGPKCYETSYMVKLGEMIKQY